MGRFDIPPYETSMPDDQHDDHALQKRRSGLLILIFLYVGLVLLIGSVVVSGRQAGELAAAIAFAVILPVMIAFGYSWIKRSRAEPSVNGEPEDDGWLEARALEQRQPADVPPTEDA